MGKSALKPIHVSIALNGREDTMLRILEDVEKYVRPAFVVAHISAGNYLNSSRLRHPHRQILIDEANHVRRGGPSVLAAHVRNLDELRKRGVAADDDTVILLAGNQRLFRPCWPYVRSHTLSYQLGQISDFRPPRQLPVRYPSTPWDEVTDRIPRRDDKFIQRNWYHNQFVGHMHRAFDNVTNSSGAPVGVDDFEAAALSTNASGWAGKPLNYIPHEGTFYPWWLLRHFLRAIDGVLLAQRFPNRAACSFTCQWPEEELLPTFVWQRLGDSLLRQRDKWGPPVVTRFFLGPLPAGRSCTVVRHPDDTHRLSRAEQNCTIVQSWSGVLGLLNWSSAGWEHICGIKVPLMQVNELP